MNTTQRRKIFAGRRVRKLRVELGLSQSAMAGELGVSLSYLNLIERNERPLTAQLLIKMAETYSIDARSFAQEEEQRSVTELEEIFADPVFQNMAVTRAEIGALADDAPRITDAMKRLYQAFVEVRDFQQDQTTATGKDERGERLHFNTADNPVEQVRSFIEKSGNYFDRLEQIAATVSAHVSQDGRVQFERIVLKLLEQHGIRVQITAIDDMRNLVRHFDRHRNKLMISELLDHSSKTFQAAFQLGLHEAGDVLDDISIAAGVLGSEAQKLARIVLCNYFAAAVMMPYDTFHAAAVAHAYDIDILMARFSASFEQVAHRLTTLARPSKRGVPFFMIRVDIAGNVSKRFSSGAFPFSRFGGTCARWNIHNAFRNPGQIERDIVEMPDGGKWFSVSRTVHRRATPWGDPGAQFVIGLGCDLRFAGQLVYSKGLDLKSHAATPIGINCRLCERQNCAQRATPPLMRKLVVQENSRGVSPFGFGV